jgi:antitoxin (DNA-binding transcriptional repressor) of toxin-antitoxin stability system
MGRTVRTVNVQDAKTQLSRLLREVESGSEIAIARAGRVVAHLVRAPEGDRQWGLFAGQGRLDDDAFAPLPQDQVDDWEGGGL